MRAREQSRPAPETVTRYSEGNIPEPRRRTRAAEVRARSTVVSVERIDPLVMAYALDLAGGDASRLRLNREDGTVTVLNKGRQE